jgi:MoaA/NifB/PqqE/SkfB family radical SAM enzyme
MLLLCNYYVTYRCNAYCDFCHFGDHTNFKNTKFADLDDYRNNIEQIAKLGVKFLDLTGGEPLLHKNIVEMVEYAKSLKLQTSITTNGLLYPKYAEKLAGKVNLLHFSLDSPYEAVHNKIRGVDCFQSVLKSIELAKSLGEFPDILFTVTNDTYESLPEMYKLALKFDLVLIVNPVFSYFGNPGLNGQAIEYIENYSKGKSNIYLNSAYLELRKNGGNKRDKPLCKAVSRVIVISPDNEIILPCYHFGNEKIKIDRPIKEIRNTQKIKDLIKMEGRFDFCEGCTVNCYFEPSFAFPTNLYGLISLPSKIRYSYQKLIRQKFILKNTAKTVQVKK